ncbi:hypothetical protein PV516_19560 [Streptomyces scabiei]|uniref:hypothetical protein n=1 Tax=Streptomyces scabiei TaxID=1930 RepID=UPI0029A0682C|nr:hypothetical protein [Streptomyces scabiei]MDX3165988.1 hypothetical protein [Streptomyces scabiei]
MPIADAELVAAENLRRTLAAYDTESLLDLLTAHREQVITRLRKACAALRADLDARAAAHQRLLVLLTASSGEGHR